MAAESRPSPLQAMQVLAITEQRVTPTLRHLEIYTLGGLVTLLWHGDPSASDVVLACGGAMGGVLGPGGGLYHDLGEALAPQGIAVVRVGYRRPNDLDACVHDLVATAELASRSGAQRYITMGHSFGGAVALRAALLLKTMSCGVVTFATQSAGCEVAGELEVPLLLFHGDQDQILPMMASEVVSQLCGHGELVVLPGCDHLMAEGRPAMFDRLQTWIPDAFSRD